MSKNVFVVPRIHRIRTIGSTVKIKGLNPAALLVGRKFILFQLLDPTWLLKGEYTGQHPGDLRG
jgi:hypothetical protein